MNIGYKLVKNAMPATAAKAPYLGMAIPVGSLAYDNILREMIKAGTKMTQPTAKFFLDALYEYAAETIAADVVRINLGNVAIYPMIDGSFDSEDAPFDPKRNTLYVGASVSQDLRDRVAGIAPDYAGDVSLGTVKLHSCMDLAGGTFRAIDGTNPFRLAGANLTVPDAEDESLALYAKDGVTKVADIVVTETDGGQQITCKLDGSVGVPKGTYKVRLASHGLDPTDPLTVATLTVTLVEAIPEPEPFEITDVRTDGEGGESGRIADGEDIAIVGSGFTDASVVNVRYTRAASGEEEDIYLLGSMIESLEPGRIVVGSGFWESIGSSMDKTKKATFYVTESDPSTGEIVKRTNSFDAFVVDA